MAVKQSTDLACRSSNQSGSLVKTSRPRKTKSGYDPHNHIGFKAEVTPERVLKVESAAAMQDINRRIVLSTMARSGPELVEFFRDESNHDTLFFMLEATSGYIDYLKAAVDIAESARARLIVAGEVIASGQKLNSRSKEATND